MYRMMFRSEVCMKEKKPLAQRPKVLNPCVNSHCRKLHSGTRWEFCPACKKIAENDYTDGHGLPSKPQVVKRESRKKGKYNKRRPARFSVRL